MRDSDHICDHPDHIVFHIGTNYAPSKKALETKGQLILELAIPSKAKACDVSI